APILRSSNRPTPTSSLLPYTTLFRSHDNCRTAESRRASGTVNQRRTGRAGAQNVCRKSSLWLAHPDWHTFCAPARPVRRWLTVRSEEHTSELQSRVDLVCRPLLEKKK